MKKVWEKKKRGPAHFFIRIPLFILLGIVNIVLISWFLHIIHCAFTDTSTMSLMKWTGHVFTLAQGIFRDLIHKIEGFMD
jgi:hypothetical protein